MEGCQRRGQNRHVRVKRQGHQNSGPGSDQIRKPWVRADSQRPWPVNVVATLVRVHRGEGQKRCTAGINPLSTPRVKI